MRVPPVVHRVWFVFFCTGLIVAEQRYPVKGLVVKLDPAHKTLIVSSEAISGYMDAMTMPYSVRNAEELKGLGPGTLIDFTLVVEGNTSFVEGVHEHKYQGLEPDPLAARRLRLLNQVVNPPTIAPVAVGARVPNFTLLDQNRHKIALSRFAGKVVLLNFVYTRCALPNFCFRSSNNFGLLQSRFREKLGRDLVLLTVTFDPVHDDSAALAKYAATWKADPQSWHFLTGSVQDVRRVCELFKEDFFPDEGLMNHSLHTVVIDRKGTLVANLEGNEFSAQELGDLVQQVFTDEKLEAKSAGR